jgi:hypothetical protein
MPLPGNRRHESRWERCSRHDLWTVIVASALGSVIAFGVITLLLSQ